MIPFPCPCTAFLFIFVFKLWSPITQLRQNWELTLLSALTFFFSFFFSCFFCLFCFVLFGFSANNALNWNRSHRVANTIIIYQRPYRSFFVNDSQSIHFVVVILCNTFLLIQILYIFVVEAVCNILLLYGIYLMNATGTPSDVVVGRRRTEPPDSNRCSSNVLYWFKHYYLSSRVRKRL